MTLGIDEDWAKVNPAAVPYDFIVGYESEDTTGKNLTVQDIQAIHAAQKDVGIVYEFNPQSALLGAPEGHRTASVAIAHARMVGAPPGVCLYNASFDFNVQPEQYGMCDSFLSAYVGDVHNAGFRGGPYSGYNYIQHAGSLSLADFYWQTYAWSLDANGQVQWSPYAVLHQYANGVNVAGALVDLDSTSATDWGQWSWRSEMNTPEALIAFSRIDTLRTGQDAANAPYLNDPAYTGNAPLATFAGYWDRLAKTVAANNSPLTDADRVLLQSFVDSVNALLTHLK